MVKISKNLLLIFFLFLFLQKILSFSVAVITDVHLDLNYDPESSSEDNCQKGKRKTSTIAYYGRKNCDSPFSLFKSALMKIKSLNPDLVLVPGDLASHFVQLPIKQDFNLSAYRIIQNNIANFTNTIGDILFGLPIMFTPGNGDYLYNYQVPKFKHKHQYYNFLYKKWILDIYANKNAVLN